VALALGCTWALAVGMWSWGPESRTIPLDLGDFAVERASVQVALAAVTVCSILVTAVRRDELPAWRTR
jgi:hypothetical protein